MASELQRRCCRGRVTTGGPAPGYSGPHGITKYSVPPGDGSVLASQREMGLSGWQGTTRVVDARMVKTKGLEDNWMDIKCCLLCRRGSL